MRKITQVPVRQRSAFIRDELNRRIRKGTYDQAQPLPSERELADEFKVARSTVRTAIEALIQEDLIDRRPGIGNFVRKMRKASKKEKPAAVGTTIGVHVSKIDNPFFSNMASHLERHLAAHGFSMLLASSYHDPRHERGVMERMSQEGVRGLISFPRDINFDRSEYRNLMDRKVPVVFLGEPGDFEVDFFGTDNRTGMEVAIDHLMELGHRSIGYVSAFPETGMDFRLEILKEVAAARGIPLKSKFIFQTKSYDEVGGREALTQMLRLKSRPSALITINDITAIGVMREAKVRGVSVPKDLSLVGFDDIPLAALLDVPLTTVRQPVDELAELAVDRLMARIKGKRGRPMRVRLLPELIERASTASCGS